MTDVALSALQTVDIALTQPVGLGYRIFAPLALMKLWNGRGGQRPPL